MISTNMAEYARESVDERRAHLQELSKGVALAHPSIQRVHTSGIEPLDRLLGQGLLSGQVVEWRGPSSCGKTGLLRGLIQSLRRQGVAVAWIDSARALLAADWAEPLAGPLWILRPPRPQDAFFCAEAILRTQSFGVVVLDGAPSSRGNLHLRLQRLARRNGAALVMMSTGDGAPGIPQAQKRIRIVSSDLEGDCHFAQKGPLRWRIEARDLRETSAYSTHEFLLQEPPSTRLLFGRPVRDRPGRQGRSGERYGR